MDYEVDGLGVDGRGGKFDERAQGAEGVRLNLAGSILSDIGMVCQSIARERRYLLPVRRDDEQKRLVDEARRVDRRRVSGELYVSKATAQENKS